MNIQNLAGTTAVIALLSGTAAIADITPEEVWQNWQDQAVAAGQTITAGSATRDGAALVVKDVTTALANDGTTTEANIDEITFVDQGDGTVGVTISDSFLLETTFPSEEGATPNAINMEISQPGLKIKVSGSTAETRYDFTAPTVGVKLTSIGGVKASVANPAFDLSMTGLEGSYLFAGAADARTLSSALNLLSLALTISWSDPEGQTDFNMTATLADIKSTSNGNVINAAVMDDLPTALKAGLTTEGDLSFGAMKFDIAGTEAGATSKTKIAGSAASGNMDFAFDASRLQYSSDSKDFAITIQAPEIPFPEVKVNYAEAAFNLLMPLEKSDTPADFNLLTRIVGLSVSDEIWGIIDPEVTLPRDPATLIIDAKGTTTITHDIMDPAQMEALGYAPPAMLNALEITELKATMAGADLSGKGAFTFDNADTTTFPGIPAPSGKIDLKLLGANGLMDNLVTLGLLKPEDIIFPRFAMSMFAKAGPGEDELSTTIEFKDKGLFANGQQLQ